MTSISNAALGRIEEQNVCQDLEKNTLLRKNLESFVEDLPKYYERLADNSKADIQSTDGTFKAQIKKYYENRFQSLDRS
jgi:hypothetical protein